MNPLRETISRNGWRKRLVRLHIVIIVCAATVDLNEASIEGATLWGFGEWYGSRGEAVDGLLVPTAGDISRVEVDSGPGLGVSGEIRPWKRFGFDMSLSWAALKASMESSTRGTLRGDIDVYQGTFGINYHVGDPSKPDIVLGPMLVYSKPTDLNEISGYRGKVETEDAFGLGFKFAIEIPTYDYYAWTAGVRVLGMGIRFVEDDGSVTEVGSTAVVVFIGLGITD